MKKRCKTAGILFTQLHRVLEMRGYLSRKSYNPRRISVAQTCKASLLQMHRVQQMCRRLSTRMLQRERLTTQMWL